MEDFNVFVDVSVESMAVVRSTLNLRAVQLSQAGQYICTATNPLGNDTAQANITVFGELKAMLRKSSIFSVTIGSSSAIH